MKAIWYQLLSYIAHAEESLDGNNLPHITLYGLRHTVASVMIARGMSAKEVANQLGHAQASTTLDIYAHAFEDANARAAQVVANAYDFAREQLQQA